ncbi:MAG TPA: Ig-like domain-containing protein [Steroidobacteraceae bacterium]|jgi:hypothetical protein
MGCIHQRKRVFACVLPLLCCLAVQAAPVEPLFNLSQPHTAPAPSNRFTAIDLRNLTNLRINLPKPDCTQRPSDCQDIEVLNTLDGFNLQPRLSIPFSGAIDPASVNSSNVFLVKLGDTTRFNSSPREFAGINQVVWDPTSNTLFAESDALLDEHTLYALIVTDGIRDTRGRAISGNNFRNYWWDLSFLRSRDPGALLYRIALLAGVSAAPVPPQHIVAASVFTTQSASTDLEKIRNQIKHTTPRSADFAIASDGSRATYPLASLTGVLFSRQVGTAPSFQVSAVPTPALNAIPGVVASIAYGRYASPLYETAQGYIPASATRTGSPRVQGMNQVYFDLYLPAGPKPAGGWPVALFGHGFTDSKEGAPLAVASVMASRGIATIAINVVGHGGGSLGTLLVNRLGVAPVSIPAGGRGIDQDGNGTIDSTEGVNALPPQTIVSSRDGLRQTVIDLMQLVRLIETGGIDTDNDGIADLDRQRIYYFGQSFGGIYGTMLLGVEPSIRAGAINVAGGSIIEVARLGAFRALVGQALAVRQPSLLNAPPLAPPQWGFNENLPLRDQPAVVNNVAGAIAIQNYFDWSEWASQSGNPVAYAPLIRKDPLHGQDAKPVIVQFAKGDGVVPNPTNSALVRAGDLADRSTFYRNDLAFAANPAVPKNPHSFLTGLGSPATAAIAVAAQTQIALFLASDGAVTIDPDGAGPLFETPIPLPLPEDLGFIP